jgi:hypothetical protein
MDKHTKKLVLAWITLAILVFLILALAYGMSKIMGS